METTYYIRSGSGPLSNVIISEALFKRAIASKITHNITVTKDELEWIVRNNPEHKVPNLNGYLTFPAGNVLIKTNPFRKVQSKKAHVDYAFAKTMVNSTLPFFFFSSVDNFWFNEDDQLKTDYPILNVLNHTKFIFTENEIIQKVKELTAESPEFIECIDAYNEDHENECVPPLMEIIESFIKDGYDYQMIEADILEQDDVCQNIVYLACILLFDPSYKQRISMADIPDYAYSARKVNYSHLILTDMIFTASGTNMTFTANGTKFFNANGSSSTITDEDYLLLLC